MAVNYKPLRRTNEWGTDKKRVIERAFALAETAADPSTSATISRDAIHAKFRGKLSAQEEQDFRAIFDALRTAIDDDNTSFDIDPHLGATRFTSAQKRVIRAMCNSVIAMISA